MIYADHHATTPCDPRVVQTMLPYFSELFANPASLTHPDGRKASSTIEDARIAVARFLGALPEEIVFTAGATESNNIAVNFLKDGDHAITSAIEHKSVLLPLRRLRGVEVTELRPDREGFVDPEQVRAAIKGNTRLVSIEAANGEIGTIQPIAPIGAVCRERGVIFHSDITQAAGKIPLDLANVDLASFSAHKFYGPKGIGGLLVRRGVRVEPLSVGGGQERGIRSGTVNVPGVVGLAAALRLRAAEMGEEAERLTRLRNDLWDSILAEITGVSVHGPRALRLPGNLNVSFERVEAESLLLAMRRFSLSSGSACSSGERGPSPVLSAIGAESAAVTGSIRVGFGKSNVGEHAPMLVEDLRRAVSRLREIASA